MLMVGIETGGTYAQSTTEAGAGSETHNARR